MRFVAGSSGSITKVVINLSASSPTETIEIRSADAIGTAGTLRGTLTYSTNSAVSTYYSTTFTGSASVTANSEYWIIFKGTSGYICHDASTITYANAFSMKMTNTQYQWAYQATAFTETKHWSMRVFADTVAADAIAPTFPSSDSFVVAENQTNIATITSSESATISIFGGVDQAKFSLARVDTSSATLAFATAPNFEAPTDTDLNNTYVVVLRAIDGAGNAGYETITTTIIDVDEVGRLLSYSLSSAPLKGISLTLIATVNYNGKVTFFVNNKKIPRCISLSTTGSGPIVATCSWKPAVRGDAILSFQVTPTGPNYSSLRSNSFTVAVGSRNTNR